MDDPTATRATMAQTIQASAADDEDLNGAALMGWVLVSEWMDGTGSRWLTRLSSDAQGESPPEWQVRGYLHEFLFASPIEPCNHDEDEA